MYNNPGSKSTWRLHLATSIPLAIRAAPCLPCKSGKTPEAARRCYSSLANGGPKSHLTAATPAPSSANTWWKRWKTPTWNQVGDIRPRLI